MEDDDDDDDDDDAVLSLREAACCVERHGADSSQLWPGRTGDIPLSLLTCVCACVCVCALTDGILNVLHPFCVCVCGVCMHVFVCQAESVSKLEEEMMMLQTDIVDLQRQPWRSGEALDTL